MADTWTVLIVDDDATARRLMRSSLERLGLIVAEATNGEDAISVFRASHADLVLLDATMPVMDGFEACKAIRGIRFGRDIPIIMITSLADSASVKRATKAGATDYLTKPLNWVQLSQKIQGYLESSRQTAAPAI